ncbi:hypothetical protein [Nocardioides bruguierae]|uniref:hypothetical protein n=1 Tax=Nocardioides bruguierae TaxID=2945102 RepID=UPI002021FF63|nr:hypothetical protein [Nocardioides bruguierae]MCL8024267.1 hypothetical protein [Nocardioides bruguierae]
MARTILDDVIDTDYGRLDLAWTDGFDQDGDVDSLFEGQANGLVGAASADGVHLTLARRSGGSHVTVTLHDVEPAPPDDAWEDVVEVSTVVTEDAAPRWVGWAGEDSGPLPVPPGEYRLRVSATGRDAGRDGEFADEVVDRYAVDLWPASRATDAILRVTSSDAATWHEARGSRP